MTQYVILTDDRTEYEYAFHGLDFLLSLWDMDQWLRGQIKYNSDGLSGEQLDALEKARDELRDIMTAHGVSLEMLE